MDSYDVAVAGGGPAGAAAALRLAGAGRRVLLANAGPRGAFRVGEGLPPSARSLLAELGLLQPFLADGHRPSYGTLSAWGSPDLRPADFLFHPAGHGFQLDRARFDAMLRAAAAAAGVEVCENTRLENLECCPTDGFRLRAVSLGQLRQLTCRWLVDATGRRNWVARRQGATRLRLDRLVAFYTIWQTETATDQDGRTWVEACPAGWWYSVLLPTRGRLVVYLTDADLVNRRQLLSRSGFEAQLAGTEHLRALCAAHSYSLRQRPRGADASSARLDQFAGPNWAAVGDAALSFDPLSSQGIANALYTGLKAGRAIALALDGDDSAIAPYAAHLAAIYETYCHHRAAFYSDETRWADHPFWQRRHRPDR